MYKTFIKKIKKHAVITAMLTVASLASFAQALQGGTTYPINGTENAPTSFATLRSAIAYLTTNGVAGNGQVILEFTENAGDDFVAPNANTPITIGNITGTSATLGITIRPGVGVTKTLTADITRNNVTKNDGTLDNSVAVGTIVLNGARYITIDGRQGGIGNMDNIGLTIINTSTSVTGASSPSNSTATVKLNNKASNNVITYTKVQGSAFSLYYSGVVLIGHNSNNDNVISYNDISSVSTSNYSHSLIYSWSFTTILSEANSNNLIKGNKLHSFGNRAIFFYNGNGAGCRIEDNSIYDGAPSSLFGFYITSANNLNTDLIVTNNYIGGKEPLCGGDAMVPGSFSAIATGNSNLNTLTISNNTISNIAVTGSSTLNGINIGAITSGTINISNNDIHNLSTQNASLIGILTSATATTAISANKIHTLSSNSNAAGINTVAIQSSATSGILNILRNNIYGLRTISNLYAVYYTNSGTQIANVVNNTFSMINGYDGDNAVAKNCLFLSGAGGTSTYNLYYNTIHLDNTAINKLPTIYYGVYLYGGTLNFRNNIFSNASRGAVVVGAGVATINLSNNLFISASTATATTYSGNINTKYGGNIDGFGPAPADLAELFDNTTILTIHPSSKTLIQSGGANIVDYNKDINDLFRHETTPSLGAYEYNNLPLPVNIISFNAKENNNKVQFNWSVGAETNVNSYEVERLQANGSYVTVVQVAATGATNYMSTDAQPLIGDNYYRLKSVDNDGTVGYYAELKNVKIATLSDKFVSVYPNPVTGNTITVSLANYPAGQYSYKLVSVAGNVVQKGQFNNNGSNVVALPTALAKGVYVLNIVNGTNVVQSKLLKN